MDFFSVSLLYLCVITVSTILLFLFTKSKPAIDQKLPPGRNGWPVIGETLEFFGSGRKGNSAKCIFDRMSKYSPLVFRTSILLEDTAVFCGSAGNKFLFTNETKLVQTWWPSSVNKIFPSTNDNSNLSSLRLRKMLANILKPEALQQYIPVMDEITHKHFAMAWDNKDIVMTYKLIKDFTFWIACKIFVSIDNLETVKRLLVPFESIVEGFLSIPIDLPGTKFRKGINSANWIRNELMAVVKQRKIDLAEGKALPTQDVLSHMLVFTDEEGQSWTEYEIADKILGLLVGGHDSSSSVASCIVKYLAELPDIYDGVYKEQMGVANSKAPGELLNWEDISKMKYSWKVACEVLRLFPPAEGTFREALTNFTYNGYSIPKGWKLYWSASATHRNPEYFPDPEKFDPSRFDGNGVAPFTFVPFGGGPRMCPGKEFAQLKILVFMHHLVKRFKWEKINLDEEIIVNPTPKPAKGLPIRLYAHNG